MRLFRQSMTGITSKDTALNQMREDRGEGDQGDPWYALCPSCMVLVEVETDERGRPQPCGNCGGSLRESLSTVALVRVHWHAN